MLRSGGKNRIPRRVKLSRLINGDVDTRCKKHIKHKSDLVRSNKRCARQTWGELSAPLLNSLTQLTKMYGLSVASGHLQLLDRKWYITHSGLLRVGHRNCCAGIRTTLQVPLSDPMANRWVFKAIVYREADSKGFISYGDADPSNTSPLVRGAEMRVAETRAVNRALRRAYGIGLCSVEELGSFSAPQRPIGSAPASNGHAAWNGSSNGSPRLRDRLCLLIRQHNLDPALVKAYAADFCGTASLKDARRDLVESFITQLAVSAEKDREALVCKLNSYAQRVEIKP
jgi:hypothetical protein